MDLISWVMVGILGGAFLFGIWFMLVREDDRSSRTMTIHRQDLTRRGAPDFSKAHNEFDRKLSEIERHLSAKRRDERAIALAEEEVRKKLAEEAAAKGGCGGEAGAAPIPVCHPVCDPAGHGAAVEVHRGRFA